MAHYEVRVVEVFGRLEPVGPGQEAPKVRTVICRVTADSSDEARDAWRRAWEAKHGTGTLPVQSLVEVIEE